MCESFIFAMQPYGILNRLDAMLIALGQAAQAIHHQLD